jgi:predicted unusual protein kinase regulating ubiquinone biosynthesis (AarF/ABC1/UbiB family)
MASDLRAVRTWARFLAKTEVGLDLVSAMNELESQVTLEFDFERKAAVMDAVGRSLDRAGMSHRVAVPWSIPGLVTPRLLTMTFMDGLPLSRLKVCFS